MRAGLVAAAVLAAALSACGSPSSSPAVSSDPGAGTPGRREPPQVIVELSKPSKAAAARITSSAGYRLETLGGRRLASVAGSTSEAWVSSPAGTSLGGRPLPREGAVVIPVETDSLTVDGRRYPGTLRISRSLDGAYRIYVATDVESYLVGVVPGEIPAKFPRESQRVQAIIARTYTLSRSPQALRGDPLLLADTGRVDQEYVGIPANPKHLAVARDAVRSTRGLVALDGATPLRAWYHSTCGGHTSPAAPVFKVNTSPALAGVPCGYCTASKYYTWTVDIPKADVVRAAGMKGSLETLTVGRTSPGGRAATFDVRAGGRTRTVNAAEFRLALGPSRLRSTRVTAVRSLGTRLRIDGRGWGHGVGLCQMGAKSLADRGSRAEDVVRVYYPGVSIRELW